MSKSEAAKPSPYKAAPPGEDAHNTQQVWIVQLLPHMVDQFCQSVIAQRPQLSLSQVAVAQQIPLIQQGVQVRIEAPGEADTSLLEM